MRSFLRCRPPRKTKMKDILREHRCSRSCSVLLSLLKVHVVERARVCMCVWVGACAPTTKSNMELLLANGAFGLPFFFGTEEKERKLKRSPCFIFGSSAFSRLTISHFTLTCDKFVLLEPTYFCLYEYIYMWIIYIYI